MTPIKYEIEPAKETSFNTIAVFDIDGKKKYLHSAISPSKEKNSLKELLDSVNQDTIIVLGCGLGYHLYPLLSKQYKLRIIIIDILENIQKFALNEKIPADLQQSNNIEWITGNNIHNVESFLNIFLNLEESRSIFICEHPASLRLFPEFYSDCRKIIDASIRNKVGNIATKRSFGKLYQKNILKHSVLSKNAYPVNALKNICKNQTAIVISSAPSADMYIEQIKHQSDKIIVFCVDSAYSILKINGIRPDFIISIDPQPWIEEHFSEIDPSIPVIASFSSWKCSISHVHLFLSLSSHPFCQILEYLYPKSIGSIDSGTGTVAGDAIQAALYTGCSHIYLCGLDFSFPNHCIYSKNSTYNKRFTGFLNNRVISNESHHINYIRRSGKKTVSAGIPTRESFLQFKSLIERMIIESSANFFYLKGNGLIINGTKPVQLIDITENSAKKVQLINKLSTLSTIGSLININSFLSFLSRKEIITQALKSCSADDERNIHYITRLISKINTSSSKQ